MKIKTSFLLIAAFGITFSIQAQEPKDALHHGHGRHHEAIEKMVSDLSAPQKKKLETIKKESHQRIKDLRQSQKGLRDSIHTLMEAEGDQSAKLAPLFDREGMIQAKISKEMYSTRVSIDKVLTDQQRKELKANLAKQNDQKKVQAEKHRKGASPKEGFHKDMDKKHACKMDCKKTECTKATTDKVK